MSQSSRTELAEILFEEIETYLPKIDRGLTLLEQSDTDQEALAEVHRLFHNIKGAASQVAFQDLSKTAAVCEAVIDDLLENDRHPVPPHLDFLGTVNKEIRTFCSLQNRSLDAEKLLFSETARFFRRLQEKFGAHLAITLPENIRGWLASENDSAAAADDHANRENLEDTRTECVLALRSILPLLQELAACSSDVALIKPERVLRPMGKALATLAQCTLAAGLAAQHELLSVCLIIIERLQSTTSLFNQDSPALLQELLSYIDVVFSLPPDEAETTIARVQPNLDGLLEVMSTRPIPNAILVENDETFSDLEKDLDFTQFEEQTIPDEDVSDLLASECNEPDIESELFGIEDEEAELSDSLLAPEISDVDQYAEQAVPDEEFSQLLTSDFEEPDSEAGLFSIEDEEMEPPVPQTAPEMSDDERELLAIFQAECEEHLLSVNEELNRLEADVRQDAEFTPELRETVGRMRRAVHTLKGAAAMTGFDNLSSCAHSLEDLLDWLHDESADINQNDVQVIAESIDTIDSLAQQGGAASSSESAAATAAVSDYLLKRQGDVPLETESDPGKSAETLHEESAEKNTPAPINGDAQAAENPEGQALLPGAGSNIRVKLDDLDELANMEGELIVSRGSIEKLLETFVKTLGELNTVKDSLYRKSQELEVGFEAQSLYGFGPAPLPGSQPTQEEPVSALSEFDPIELDRYSQLNLIIRSLNEITIDVNAIHTQMTGLATSLRGQVAKQQLAMGVMQEKLMRIRMTPLSSLSRLLFRTVRQTAKKLGKDVRLTITGEDVFMDRFVWSKTIDPLMHILRNCIDHGIEDSETRRAAGKPAAGHIAIDAVQHSRFVVLRISDDGGGIDVVRLRAKLIAEDIIAAADAISDEDLLPYLFRPSISTREDISQISGRGVGLDVVLKNIQELRGNVQITNSPGLGVAFELSIPISLSVNRAIIISIASRQYAVPLQEITEVRRFAEADTQPGDTPQVLYNDQPINLVALAPKLGLPATASDTGSGRHLALLVSTGDAYVALEIDRVVEQREIITKDLGSHLRYVRGISGITLTGEGTIIPILNLREVISGDQATIGRTVVEKRSDKRLEPLKILIVDDSISVRYSISRLVESQSWQPYQAVDGIDALEKLESVTPDIIVLDIEMPRMNGYEFMSALRHDESHHSIPVVMLTSRASEKHRKKAEELGVNHYITKPFQETAFIQLLESMREI